MENMSTVAILEGAPTGHPPTRPVKRIAIVDDHPIVRNGLKQLLGERPGLAVEGEAASAEEALSLVRKGEWDLVVLDIGLPGRSGLDLLRDLRKTRPRLPVLVLSVHAEEEFAVRTIRAGASGYLTKGCASEELLRAISLILAGHKYISPSVAEKLADEIRRDGGQAPHDLLSDRELEVLSLIASGKTAKEVAAALAVSKSTVSTYRLRILEKLKLGSNAEITRYALQHGLVI